MYVKKLFQESIRCFQTHNNRTNFPKRYVIKFVFVGAVGCMPVFYYTSLNDRKKRQIQINIGGIERFFRSAIIGLVISVDYWWSLRRFEENSKLYLEYIETVHQRSAERIAQCCLKNGGLYIKLGQGLVNLDHLLPKQYTQTLKILQDKCLVRKENEIVQLFQEDFGVPYTEIYESFNEQPIAAASLAQVFKARTKDGVDVAVKAQYIDLRDRFNGDIATVKFLLKCAGRLFPNYNFEWILNELHTPLELELDFSLEGKNTEKCSKDLAHLGYVYVPKVYWDKSSKRILTTEFIDGIKINETETLQKENYSLVDIDTKLFKTFAEQIFHTGFIHADPHPGNILVRRSKDGSAQLVLLDHGLYETLPSNLRISLTNLWRAIVMNNHTDMKKYSTELGIDGNDYRLFCIALAQRYVPTEHNDDQDLLKWFFNLKGSLVTSALNNLTKENKENKRKIKAEAEKIQEQLMNIFQRLPGKLLLVCRNLNTVRSIARIHGNLVDRHSIMAHCAVQHIFSKSSIKKFHHQIMFEMKLWFDKIKRFFLKYIFRWFQSSGSIDGFV